MAPVAAAQGAARHIVQTAKSSPLGTIHDVVRPVSIAPPQARHPTARRDPGVTANVAVTIILPASPWSANAKEIRR